MLHEKCQSHKTKASALGDSCDPRHSSLLAVEMNITGLIGGIHHSICLFLSQTLSFVYTSSFHYSFSGENSKSLGLFSPIPTTQGETLGKVNIAMLTNSLSSHLCSPGTLFKGTRHEWGPETSSWVPFVHMVTGLWTKLLILWAGDSQSLLCRTR